MRLRLANQLSAPYFPPMAFRVSATRPRMSSPAIITAFENGDHVTLRRGWRPDKADTKCVPELTVTARGSVSEVCLAASGASPKGAEPR